VKDLVLQSIENPGGDRCVDIFRRPDGTFGFEEWRRDAEDGGRWTRTGAFAGQVYSGENDALSAARSCVGWLIDCI